MAESLLSPAAESDLIHIYLEGLERFGLLQADKYQTDLHEKFELLAKFSGLGSALKVHDRPFRRYPYKAHLILFEPIDKGVNIIRVIHGSSNYMEHLEED